MTYNKCFYILQGGKLAKIIYFFIKSSMTETDFSFSTYSASIDNTDKSDSQSCAIEVLR